MLLSFWQKVQNKYIKGRLIFFYQLIGFSIYAIPGYSNSINTFGAWNVLKGMLLYLIIMFILKLTLDWLIHSHTIRINIKAISLYLIYNFIVCGYFLYYDYCSNVYVYLLPIFGILLLKLVEKIKGKIRMRMLPEYKE